MTFVFHGDFDVRADGGTIRFHAGKPHGNPVIIVAGISENAESVGITGRGTARIEKDILMAIISEVGEGDTVAFVKFPGTGRRSNIRKVFSCVVAKQRVGSHCAVFGTASP